MVKLIKRARVFRKNLQFKHLMPFRNKKFELSPRLKLGVGRGYSQNQILKFSAIIFLILAAVLTGYSLRLIFKSAGSTADPQILGVSDIKDLKPNATLEFNNYIVQKGDTLFNISQKFKIDWSTLAMLNNLKSPFILKTGQTINIPK